MEDILLSIWCITYNHELYIRDAIEGFLMQKTNFKYEIIIHDDASTDKTTEIIKEYEEKYPDLIHVIYQSENQYSKHQPSDKWLWEIEAKNCKGKYIAICEGDDYWTDNQKLQLQVDYLETHPECVMTTHSTIKMDCRSGDREFKDLYACDCIIPVSDIISQKALISTASIVCKKEVLERDDFFFNVGVGDYPLLLSAITKGRIYYFKRAMSVYRYCHEGSWTTQVLENHSYCIMHNIQLISFLRTYNEYTYRKYDKFVRGKIQRHADASMVLCEQETTGDFFEVCEKYKALMDQECNIVFRRLERLYLQIYDGNYIDAELCAFTNKIHKVFVMGAGRYAAIIERQLKNHKIDFEGFVVSNNQFCDENYLGKKIWKLNELPSDLKEVGIIIGINPAIWEEIIDALENAGIKNYICPFLL